MKASSLLLTGTLILNVALLGLIGAGIGLNSTTPAVPPTGTLAAAPNTPSAPGADTWNTVQATDLAQERDRLRREGFPPAAIRAILAAQIREKYAAQRKALEAGMNETAYWKSYTPDPKLAAAQREAGRAERQELRDLLGLDPDDSRITRFQQQVPGISDEKAVTLADISDRYNEQRQQLYSTARNGGGSFSPADQEKVRGLEKAMHDEFAQVLTPQELEDFDLRASRTANQLQYQLSAFNATEAEYRALYKLQAAFDDQYSLNFGPPTQDQMRARSEATKQLQKDIEAALGPQRYADYQRGTDYNYRQTSQLMTRLELPPETADALYSIQKEYQQKQQDAYANMRSSMSGTNPEDTRQQLNAQLAALQQEATAKVNAVLGGTARATEAYKSYGGQWLRNLVPTERQGGVSSSTMIMRTGP